MDFHEMYETLRYTIQCRKCAGAGGSGAPGGDPCGVCLGSGVEGVTASDAIVEQRVVAGMRENMIYEDELPEDITDELYSWWYDRSVVDIVRMGPPLKEEGISP